MSQITILFLEIKNAENRGKKRPDVHAGRQINMDFQTQLVRCTATKISCENTARTNAKTNIGIAKETVRGTTDFEKAMILLSNYL